VADEAPEGDAQLVQVFTEIRKVEKRTLRSGPLLPSAFRTRIIVDATSR
jgi:hypothetical protein